MINIEEIKEGIEIDNDIEMKEEAKEQINKNIDQDEKIKLTDQLLELNLSKFTWNKKDMKYLRHILKDIIIEHNDINMSMLTNNINMSFINYSHKKIIGSKQAIKNFVAQFNEEYEKIVENWIAKLPNTIDKSKIEEAFTNLIDKAIAKPPKSKVKLLKRFLFFNLYLSTPFDFKKLIDMKWGDIISSVLIDGKLSYKIVLQNKCFEIPSTTAETIIKIHNYTMHPYDEERSITCKLFGGINLKKIYEICINSLGARIFKLIKRCKEEIQNNEEYICRDKSYRSLWQHPKNLENLFNNIQFKDEWVAKLYDTEK